MSQHSFKMQDAENSEVLVQLGYDPRLDYVFCTVRAGGEILYSSLADPAAGPDLEDVEYFREVVEERCGITIPQEIFDGVKCDQEQGIGNRVVTYGYPE